MARLLFIVLFACTLTACGVATTAAPPSNQFPTSAPSATVPTNTASSVFAIFVASGGFEGKVITSTFTLDAITLEPTGDVKQLADEQAAKLQSEIEQTGIYSVAPGRYMPDDLCCDRFTYRLTLFHNGQSYEYTTMDGTPNAPKSLDATIRLLSQAYNGAE